ncbi:MAG: DUF3996 domain-containing protein [Ignavibacteriales bacterium]|nr:DUF3996 domain-containing protein [Ignavibacteriales bacterium]
MEEKMKKLVLFIAIIFALVLSQSNYSQDKGFGLGFMLGDPTGISGKAWISNTNAIDFGVGWAFIGGVHDKNMFSVHVDYLIHFLDAIQSSARLPLYIGIGGRIKAHEGHSTNIGVRGSFGIEWWPDGIPLDLFLEIAPILKLVEETGFDIDGALGLRYFF